MLPTPGKPWFRGVAYVFYSLRHLFQTLKGHSKSSGFLFFYKPFYFFIFPPLNSLRIPSLWVIPVHQPRTSCIMHRTWTGDSFHICDVHVSRPFSHIIPPSPSPTESKRLFSTSVSLLLSHIWGYHYHLSKFWFSVAFFLTPFPIPKKHRKFRCPHITEKPLLMQRICLGLCFFLKLLMPQLLAPSEFPGRFVKTLMSGPTLECLISGPEVDSKDLNF